MRHWSGLSRGEQTARDSSESSSRSQKYEYHLDCGRLSGKHVRMPDTYHTFPRSGPHSIGLTWKGQRDTQLHGQLGRKGPLICPHPHLRLVQ